MKRTTRTVEDKDGNLVNYVHEETATRLDSVEGLRLLLAVQFCLICLVVLTVGIGVSQGVNSRLEEMCNVRIR